jgi:UDP-N-acetylglucosamine:LPS N-acetylglucosamine transferase
LRKLTIVLHHAGGGHRSTAEALKGVLASQDHPWEVTLLNFQELLAPLDVLRRFTGLRIEDAYNLILRKGWTRFTPQLLVVLQTAIRLYHSQTVKLLRAHWAQSRPDLVLSVIPHFNRELAESLQGDRQIPFITLLTDLADYPPRFWIERESQYLIVGTERAKQQAVAIGHLADRIFETSGMVLKPRFYQKVSIDRFAERKRLGLDPDCHTGIVLFGGHGSRVMVDIAKRLNGSGLDVQLIMICGHNHKLAAELKNLKTRKPMLVEGFTSNVESYMALADFFIGKPGPGSISEALQFHLPVIVECNSKTLPQERYNAQWVTEKGYGIVLKSFRDISSGVQRLLDQSNASELSCNVCKYSNQALFEVPAILETCWKRGPQAGDNRGTDHSLGGTTEATASCISR